MKCPIQAEEVVDPSTYRLLLYTALVNCNYNKMTTTVYQNAQTVRKNPNLCFYLLLLWNLLTSNTTDMFHFWLFWVQNTIFYCPIFYFQVLIRQQY